MDINFVANLCSSEDKHQVEQQAPRLICKMHKAIFPPIFETRKEKTRTIKLPALRLPYNRKEERLPSHIFELRDTATLCSKEYMTVSRIDKMQLRRKQKVVRLMYTKERKCQLYATV